MKTRPLKIMLAAAVSAVVIGGCASQKVAEVVADHPFTPINGAYGYVTPQEITGEDPVYVALIDVDFSKTHILFTFNVGSFVPKEKSGSVYLRANGAGEALASLAELRAKLEPLAGDSRIGVIMMIDGEPLGVGGKTPRPEQGDLFREFAAMMEEAGIKYAYIVPERISISR
jgi:hypothetical protein